MRNTDTQKNLDEFIARYGKRGVMILYFSNLLEDMVKGEFLHTLNNSMDTSPGILGYSDEQGRLLTSELLNQRADELRRECELRAIGIVDRLQRKGYLERFGAHTLEDESVIQEINSQLREIFKEIFGAEWGSEI